MSWAERFRAADTPARVGRRPRPPADPDAARVQEARYTFVVVPENGRGVVRQWSVSLWAVRTAIATLAGVLGTLVVMLGLGVALAPRILDHDDVIGQNVVLRARLQQVDAQVAEMTETIARVRVYDERLREMAVRNQLPGSGPWTAGDMEARQRWIDGVAGTQGANESLRDTPELRAAALEADVASLAEALDALGPSLERLDRTFARGGPFSMAHPPLDHVSFNSPFGWRRSPFGRGGWRYHPGLDLEADRYALVYAVQDGLVVYAGWYAGYGNVVDIDHGNGIVTRYGHNSRLLVRPGMEVTAGDEIALAGSTGWSTGVHVHFELRMDGEAVDPSPWFDMP